MQSLIDKIFALKWEVEPYILISFVSAVVGCMAFYWETLILCCLHTFFPFYSHVPPVMSQLLLYSNSARLIDAVMQRTAMVLSMDDGQKSSVIKNHLHLVPLPSHT